MGLGPAPAKMFFELYSRGILKDSRSICDIGSQEIHIPHNMLMTLFAQSCIKIQDPEAFENLKGWPGHPRCSSRLLYKELGLTEYRCIDLNGDHGAIRHDLNLPMKDQEFIGKFDVVTDFGSAEHVFNISTAYETIHDLCRPGGLIIVAQALFGGNGYYNFDPSFFESLAAANRYGVMFSSFLISLGNEEHYHIPLSQKLLECMDWTKISGSVGICYVYHKTIDAPFQTPYQGAYLTDAIKADGYRLQFLPEPLRRSYIPVYNQGLPKLEDHRIKDLSRALAKRLGNRLGL